LLGLESWALRTSSLFMRSKARDTSSVTFSTLRFLTISLIFAGTLSLRAIASLSETALPITLRLAPHDRQNFKSVEDSTPHWGQNITGTSRVIISRSQPGVKPRLTTLSGVELFWEMSKKKMPQVS